jgi:hypothetical protein
VSLVDDEYMFDSIHTDRLGSLDRAYQEEEDTSESDEGAEGEEPEHPDDDRATVSTDDPVQLAMDAVLSENEDEEEEEELILYPQRGRQ